MNFVNSWINSLLFYLIYSKTTSRIKLSDTEQMKRNSEASININLEKILQSREEEQNKES